MSKRDEPKAYNKFYHNDIKKQLGIDESRTASEKLLDKAIKVDKRADFYLNDQEEKQFQQKPQKKIKVDAQNEKPPSNKEILQNKLFKNIQNQTNLSKLLKSLTILKKCLNQQSFIEDPEIDFLSTWNLYSDRLINEITQRNYSSVESLNIMTTIGDCLLIFLNMFGHKKEKPIANQQGEINQAFSQTIRPIKEQVFVWFCRLFTDDSFIFNKNIAKLKNFVFSHFSSQSLNQSQKDLVFAIIQKLTAIPIKYDWAHSSLVNLFKEFNNEGYQNRFPSDGEKKGYLKSYNELLSRKPKSSGVGTSYNMMGNSKESAGMKTVHIETNLQSSSDKWVSKQ